MIANAWTYGMSETAVETSERAVLACAIMSWPHYGKLARALRFSASDLSPRYAEIWKAVEELGDSHVDVLSLLRLLERRDPEERWASRISDVLDAYIHILDDRDFEASVKAVIEEASRRRIAAKRRAR